jgi:transposase-like protein
MNVARATGLDHPPTAIVGITPHHHLDAGWGLARAHELGRHLYGLTKRQGHSRAVLELDVEADAVGHDWIPEPEDGADILMPLDIPRGDRVLHRGHRVHGVPRVAVFESSLTRESVSPVRGAAMHRRTWDADLKAKIVLHGLQGRPVAELCHEYHISPSLYDQWRDQFLAHAARTFAVQPYDRKEARLARENARLKTRVGELTLELNKSAEWLG